MPIERFSDCRNEKLMFWTEIMLKQITFALRDEHLQIIRISQVAA
jgi:hypothetical protein